MTNEVDRLGIDENVLAGIVSRIGARIVAGIYIFLIILVGASFSLGAYLTDLRSQVMNATNGLSELKHTFETKSPPKWVSDSLQRQERRLDRHESRLDNLERKK